MQCQSTVHPVRGAERSLETSGIVAVNLPNLSRQLCPNPENYIFTNRHVRCRAVDIQISACQVIGACRSAESYSQPVSARRSALGLRRYAASDSEQGKH